MYSLTGKIVVITGASSGIGKALAFAALKEGASVAVCARNEDKLKELYGNVDNSVLYYASVDVSNEAECKVFMNAVTDKWGRIDVLINNAGISMRSLFEDVDTSVIRELMDINFYGAVYCTKYALNQIISNKGVIVGVSSIAGYRGLPARTGYSASKFALQGFLESLRTELLYTGVNVMWVCPGFTSSNIRKVARSSDGSAQGETPLNESKLMSAEECADIILKAVKKQQRTVVMTLLGKLTVWMNKLFPSAMDKSVYKHFLNEPDSPLKRNKTNG